VSQGNTLRFAGFTCQFRFGAANDARSSHDVDQFLKFHRHMIPNGDDLAVERFGDKQRVINLKTAKALGMKVDPSAL
jgi:hypothetical protein